MDLFDHLHNQLQSLQDLCHLQKQDIQRLECQAIQRTGDNKGKLCGQLCSGKTCPRHTLRLKPYRSYYRLYGTPVLLNKEYQAIGYYHMGQIHMVENKDVRQACSQYDIMFIQPDIEQVD